MKRYNQILVGILVVQIIVSIVVFWPKSATTGGGKPVFPDLKRDDVIGLTITDADGKHIALQKVTRAWVLPDADEYPAQEEKINNLLDKIAGLTTDRLVTRTGASHKRLQVASDDFVRRVEFEMTDSKRHNLYLGSSPRYGATHFRSDGQSETYLTNDVSTFDANATATSWTDTSYLNIPQEEITKMTLENGQGQFTFTKDTESNWTLAGLAADETLDEGEVTSLVQRASSVNMTMPLGKDAQAAYGMEEPSAVVSLDVGDKRVTLQVGAQDSSDKSYVIISSESPYYVRVSEFSVKTLVENTRDDLLQLPPTPTPVAQ